MSSPIDIGPDEEVERLSLDLKSADYQLLERFAGYRNALAKAQDKKLGRRWTRKSMAESMVAAQCDVLRQQLQEMFAAVGDLPPADDVEGLARYARRVIAWAAKKHPEE